MARAELTEQTRLSCKTINEIVKGGAQITPEDSPGFFINGQFLYGALPLEAFEVLIEGILEEGGR